MKDIVDAINAEVGFHTLLTISNVYTIFLVFYGVLYAVLWFFRRGERFKMLPNLQCELVFMSTLPFSLLFMIGQYCDRNMQYYPFSFWANVTVLGGIVGLFIIYGTFTFLCNVREKLPKQDYR